MPYLDKILLYPVKSLDGVEVETARVLASGALQYDREFALVDDSQKLVNGKRYAKIHLLRSQFSLSTRTITLQIPGKLSQQVFHLDQERQALEATLSDFFQFAVKLQQNVITGFPDDLNSSGPTVISTATLTEVASWFPGVSVEQIRRRIRANIEIGGVPPFWEDQLFSSQSETVSFRVGDVIFFGVQPCKRCVVPTRHPDSGAAYTNFQKIFVQQRQATLPNWVDASCFSHFYSLSVNTRLATSAVDEILKIGNAIEIIS
ncbi:MAG: MOSC N-terminal beta barrel domain-containing protein [Goleter apudmare HA4340-LM2]|nr:MOSC N-terminal beta barrel domain-containing protein [Goleter apudmare HA4340-LM2]